MNGENLHRRDVLKSVGAGAATAASGGHAVAVEETGYGPVRLVEVSIRYEPARDLQYSKVALNGDPVYFLDDGRVIITAPQQKYRDVFKQNDRVIGTSRVNPAPLTVSGTGKTKTLVTGLRDRRLPAERMRLTEPYTPPTVAVRETPRGLVATVEGQQIELSSGTRETIRLPSEEVTARTFRMVEDAPSIDGIPDERIGPRTEFGEATVEVTPEVRITDRGDVTVARVKPSDKSKI